MFLLTLGSGSPLRPRRSTTVGYESEQQLSKEHFRTTTTTTPALTKLGMPRAGVSSEITLVDGTTGTCQVVRRSKEEAVNLPELGVHPTHELERRTSRVYSRIFKVDEVRDDPGLLIAGEDR